MTVNLVVFGIIALLAIGASLGVVLHPHPVYCALFLIIALFQIAALFVLLDAHMVAFLQVIVYAGAIMVLFLFVIMLLNLQREAEKTPAAMRGIGLGAAALLAAEFGWFLLGQPLPAAPARALAEDFGTVTALGRSLFSDHALSFELTSVLLLVAIVGAVVIARKG